MDLSSRLYGPVPSRRFGLSLGVDLVPRKTCPYDCIYCQVGPTTEHTDRRATFVPADDLAQAVARALEVGPRPEVITLAGSGEPTLQSPLDTVIERLRTFGLPVVLLTNGALLHRPDVLAEALRADVLAPSLDAPDEHTFARINRPVPGLTFGSMFQGVAEAIRRHPRVRLEVMLVPGVNDGEPQLRAFEEILAELRPWAIDLNTPVRPAPGRVVQPIAPERMEAIARRFGPAARVIAEYSGRTPEGPDPDIERRILETIARRPCTAADLAQSLGLTGPASAKILERLVRSGRAVRQTNGGEVFFFANVP